MFGRSVTDRLVKKVVMCERAPERSGPGELGWTGTLVPRGTQPWSQASVTIRIWGWSWLLFETLPTSFVASHQNDVSTSFPRCDAWYTVSISFLISLVVDIHSAKTGTTRSMRPCIQDFTLATSIALNCCAKPNHSNLIDFNWCYSIIYILYIYIYICCSY